MLVNELRIGNWVNVAEDQPQKVIALMYQYGDDEYKIHYKREGTLLIYAMLEREVNPIPITEEWLLKFGFKKKQTHYTHSINRDYEFILDSDFTLCDIDIFVSVKYVHQLQNLYFALTGKELTCL